MAEVPPKIKRTDTPQESTGVRGAVSKRTTLRDRLHAYLLNHSQQLPTALNRFFDSPFATIMTVAVIGVALALPSGMLVLLQNVQQVSSGLEQSAKISVFMRPGADLEQARELADQLALDPQLQLHEFITPTKALQEFKELSGFGDALNALMDNPLPAVIVLAPSNRAADPAQMEFLLNRLRDLPNVDFVQLDMDWVKRLHSLFQLAQRAVWVIGILLAVSVLLVIGNTIRLEIENRRDEIVITKLIGGTNRFIRRPFLYSGIVYGLLGSLTAWILVTFSVFLLVEPVQRLALLYSSSFTLSGLGFMGVFGLVIAGTGLGLLGSIIAVSRHLGSIEPT